MTSMFRVVARTVATGLVAAAVTGGAIRCWAQAKAAVSAANTPSQIAVLVDARPSIEPYLGETRGALRAFSREIQDRHERALFALGARPIVVSDYTCDPARLETGIGKLSAQADSGYSMLDAIGEVSRGLRARGAPRPVIVAITTDAPEFREFTAVMNELREAGVTLHLFVLDGAERSLGDETDWQPSRGAREANGPVERLNGTMLRDRLQELAAELNNQHLVAHAQAPSASTSGTVDVTVKRPELAVRDTTSAGDPR